MNIKIVALDLDGTTLNSKGILSEKNLTAIEKAISKGILVIPATGRPYNGLPQCIKDIKGINYAVISNGASVIDISNNTEIYNNLLSVDVACDLIHKMANHDLYIDVYVDGKAFAEKKYLDNLDSQNLTEERKKIIFNTRTGVEDLAEFVLSNGKPVEKINLNCKSEETYNNLWKDIESDKRICITTSVKNLIEVNNHSTSKADGLKKLCQHLGIDRSATMAMGDGLNDTKMFDFVNISVAMGNASDEVKSYAKHVTLSNNNDGLAHAFEKFLL